MLIQGWAANCVSCTFLPPPPPLYPQALNASQLLTVVDSLPLSSTSLASLTSLLDLASSVGQQPDAIATAVNYTSTLFDQVGH